MCVCMAEYMSVSTPMKGSVSFGFAVVRWGGRGRRQKRAWERHCHPFSGSFQRTGLSYTHSNAGSKFSSANLVSQTVWKTRQLFGWKGKLREFWGLEREVRAAGDRSVAGNKPLLAPCAGRTPDQRPDWECTRTAGPSIRRGGGGGGGSN